MVNSIVKVQYIISTDIGPDAKHDKREFTLTYEDFLTFWQQPCSYCGDPIKTVGLDRVDNSKGYIKDNVVSCCKHCNTWKHTATQADFYARIRKLYSHLK